MGQKGHPNGLVRSRCVALFGTGLAVADIARQLGLTPAAVSAHLRAAGGPPAVYAPGRGRFAAAWNAADLRSLAKAEGLTKGRHAGSCSAPRPEVREALGQ